MDRGGLAIEKTSSEWEERWDGGEPDGPPPEAEGADSFEAFVRQHASIVWPVARRWAAGQTETLLVAQAALERAWQLGLRSPDPLAALVVREAVDRQARRVRPQPIRGLLPRFRPDGSFEAPPPRRRSRHASIAPARLARLVARLPEPHRSALVLRDLAQLDETRASAMLAMPRAELRGRLHEARQALTTLLDRRHRSGAS
ncbi:MAG: hypothetical protein QNK04_06380 [Myxococcota bacterium]|nr:hypothetical protein [Myxococcota bacterium]